jgi:hypothetical protein
MRHIRPYQIFTLLDAGPSERLAHVKIPNRRDLWLLETFILVTALRLVNAMRIFEFGTYFGSTTLNLALNSPASAEVFTFDLPKADALAATKNRPDFRVAGERLDHPQPDFTGFKEAEKIKTLLGNSRNFDFSPFGNSMDMVFIDGGHDYETVKSDTSNALTMLKTDAPGCIFWHDYQNVECEENTNFLNDLQTDLSLFHVQETMLCGWFNDPSGIKV